MQIDLTPTQQQFLLDCVQHYRKHCAGRLGFLRREGPIARGANDATFRNYLDRLIQQENLNGAITVLYYLLKQAIERHYVEASANDDDDDDDDCGGGFYDEEIWMAVSRAMCDAWWNRSTAQDVTGAEPVTGSDT